MRYLMVSEIVELYMKAQGSNGWFGSGTEGSAGEGLSRFLAAQFLTLTGLGSTPPGFLNSNLWLGTSRVDYVNAPNLTDDGPDAITGCSLLFIYYLHSQLGFSVNEIVGAGASTPAGVYNKLTGDPGDPFPEFKKALDTAFPGTSVITTGDLDNPFPLGILPMMRHVFSGGDGVIYALMDNGDLMWYRHDGRNDGTGHSADPRPPRRQRLGCGTCLRRRWRSDLCDRFSGGSPY